MGILPEFRESMRYGIPTYEKTVGSPLLPPRNNITAFTLTI